MVHGKKIFVEWYDAANAKQVCNVEVALTYITDVVMNKVNATNIVIRKIETYHF